MSAFRGGLETVMTGRIHAGVANVTYLIEVHDDLNNSIGNFFGIKKWLVIQNIGENIIITEILDF